MNRRLKISLALLLAALAAAALVVVTTALAQDGDPAAAPATIDLAPVPGPIGADTTVDDTGGFDAAIYEGDDDEMFLDVSNAATDPTPADAVDDATPPSSPDLDDPVDDSPAATGLDLSIDATTEQPVLNASIDGSANDGVVALPDDVVVGGASGLDDTSGGPLIENRVRSATLPIAATSYDLDADGMLDIDEFSYALDDGWFDDWDLDGDEVIVNDEFGTVAFLAWDLDGNRGLDAGEWRALTLQVFGDDEITGEFTDWDLNEDFYVTQDEFALRIDETGLFDDWDLDDDRLIDRVEFDDAAFGFYDLDDDDRVDDDELYLDPWF